MHEMLTIVTDVPGVCQSVSCGGACSVHGLPCAWGHSVQPSPNTFGLLFVFGRA